MTDPFYLGAYWGPRPESAQVCAQRLVTCLKGLGATSDVLRSWFLKGNTQREALQRPVTIETGSLADVLLAGLNRRDVNNSVITELGYSAGLWNGNTKTSAGFRVRCGASTTVARMMSNTFVLDLPPFGQADAPDPVPLKSFIHAVIDAWEPDWAVLVSDALRDAQQTHPRQPVIGWMTYLSSWRGAIPALPDDFFAEPMDGGTLIVFDKDPSALSTLKVQELATLLSAAGLLRPTP